MTFLGDNVGLKGTFAYLAQKQERSIGTWRDKRNYIALSNPVVEKQKTVTGEGVSMIPIDQ